jgi:hypothetical protein
MARRVVLSVVIAALLAVGWVSLLLASCPIPWFEGIGQVVIPGGQPVVGIYVKIYRESDGYCVGGDYTDDEGYWSWCFPYCWNSYIACVGDLRENTTECVCDTIVCSGITWFPDIVLECGGPKQPPCPSQ